METLTHAVLYLVTGNQWEKVGTAPVRQFSDDTAEPFYGRVADGYVVGSTNNEPQATVRIGPISWEDGNALDLRGEHVVVAFNGQEIEGVAQERAGFYVVSGLLRR